MARDGYVLIHRQILANPVFKETCEAYAFAHLILMAAWKPTKVRYKGAERVIERGQTMVSCRDLAAAFGRSRMWGQRLLDKLEKEGMISRKKAEKLGQGAGQWLGQWSPVITICNYDKYQVFGETVGTVGGTEAGTQKNKEKEIYTLPLEEEAQTLGKREKEKLEKEKVSLPEWIPEGAWADWLEMRRTIKKPATAGAQTLAVKRLTQFRKQGHDPGKILELATLNCWTGLFAGRNGETQRSGLIGNI